MKLRFYQCRFVSQEVCDIWRVKIPNPMNISDIFSQKEFIVLLPIRKTSKTPVRDSVCPELINHAGLL